MFLHVLLFEVLIFMHNKVKTLKKSILILRCPEPAYIVRPQNIIIKSPSKPITILVLKLPKKKVLKKFKNF